MARLEARNVEQVVDSMFEPPGRRSDLAKQRCLRLGSSCHQRQNEMLCRAGDDGERCLQLVRNAVEERPLESLRGFGRLRLPGLAQKRLALADRGAQPR